VKRHALRLELVQVVQRIECRISVNRHLIPLSMCQAVTLR
jgi:hypothetical protein